MTSPGTDATMFFVSQQLRRFADHCRVAAGRVQRADALRQVRDLGDVCPHPTVAMLRHTVPELRALRAAQERRAGELVDEHLQQLRILAKTGSAEEFNRALERCQASEWVFLRGTLSHVLHHIERELPSIRGQLPQERPAPRPTLPSRRP